jgi:hypothetical protein
MAQWLKVSTATTALIGPFVDDTDGKTAETGLTIARADCQLWKEGGSSMAQKTETTSATHRANGCYTVPIDATDTGTLGALVLSVHVAGALPVRHEYFVVPATVFDAIKAGTGTGLYSNVQAMAADVVTASAIAADAIGSSELAAGAATEIAAAVGALVCEINGSRTLQQIASILLSACAGVTTTGGAVLKDPSGTSTRISATINGSNERTAITLTPSA